MKSIIIILLAHLSYIGNSQDILSGEELIDDERSLTYIIAADSITKDKTFGYSYRIFVIQETISKEIISKDYLPVNLSADFPYRFNNQYYNSNGVLIIEGVQCCYLFFPDEYILSDPICPDLSDCEISDVQGTYIREVKLSNEGGTITMRIPDCQHPFVYDVNTFKN